MDSIKFLLTFLLMAVYLLKPKITKCFALGVTALVFVVLFMVNDMESRGRKMRRKVGKYKKKEMEEEEVEDDLSKKIMEAFDKTTGGEGDSPDDGQVVYSEDGYKNNNFKELGCLGDNELMRQMKHMGNKNREAMDGAARVDKYSNIGYFADELREAADSRGWWDNDVVLEREF